MDRILAFLLILLLSPLLIVLLFMTFIVFKCNPIFCQERTVDGTSIFKFYKIRSMRKNAPNIPTAEFNEAEKYINRWGSFLRTYSLDELLNLVSIIAGDMKFIGPRPIMTCEIQLIELRFRSGIIELPGLTGLAQVNGRDAITLTRKVACERYYSRRKNSITLRIHILFKTIIIVIKKSGIVH